MNTVQLLKSHLEHAPRTAIVADGLLGWRTPDGYFVCGTCSGRIMGRGCFLPLRSDPVWKDNASGSESCCCCEGK